MQVIQCGTKPHHLQQFFSPSKCILNLANDFNGYKVTGIIKNGIMFAIFENSQRLSLSLSHLKSQSLCGTQTYFLHRKPMGGGSFSHLLENASYVRYMNG